MPLGRSGERPTAYFSTHPTGAHLPAIPASPARPGAPEGLADGLRRKAGRPKGSLNRATKEVKAALRTTLPRAKRRLRELVASDDSDIAFRAVALIFAYSYGKPTERREVTGADGGPQLIDFLRELPE